jgi:hypothetical protein
MGGLAPIIRPKCALTWTAVYRRISTEMRVWMADGKFVIIKCVCHLPSRNIGFLSRVPQVD